MIDLVYKHSDMNKVKVNSDIIYKNINNRALKLDVYYPIDISMSQVNTVLMIHGSASIKSLKDIELYKSWGRVMAASGFTTIVFNWRPDSNSRDIIDVITFIRKNSESLKINKENITLFAFSAGVEEGIKQAMQINKGFIKRIVAYYGKIDPGSLDSLSKEQYPSVFIAMGAVDDVFSPECNDSFISHAKYLGCMVELVVHSNGEHGFDAFNKDDETIDIINKTIKFIGKSKIHI